MNRRIRREEFTTELYRVSHGVSRKIIKKYYSLRALRLCVIHFFSYVRCVRGKILLFILLRETPW